MSREKTRVIAGDTSQYPFNTSFTDHERHVLRQIRDLRARVNHLKAQLGELPRHACKPPENYKPDRMEEFTDIKSAIDSLEDQLRWIPGGAYRFAADEHQP
jgi:hypothetical protein